MRSCVSGGLVSGQRLTALFHGNNAVALGEPLLECDVVEPALRDYDPRRNREITGLWSEPVSSSVPASILKDPLMYRSAIAGEQSMKSIIAR